MIKTTDTVLWRGPNGIFRRWASVVSIRGSEAMIKLNHDIFDWRPDGSGGTVSEGTILHVPVKELHVPDMKLNLNRKKKPIAAGEIW